MSQSRSQRQKFQLFRDASGQSQCVQLATVDFGFKRCIYSALLLHAILATKAFIDHFCGKVLPVVALHGDFGVGKAFAPQGLDLVGGDGQGGVLWSG